jgi:dipeptidyl aminopeptidase/acylaminoacyl peptidase
MTRYVAAAGIAIASAVITAAILALLAGGAGAQFPGFNGRIAFTLDGQVWTMDGSGGDLSQETELPGTYGSPDWSPDGGQVVLHSDRDQAGNKDIYLVDFDGPTFTRLTSDAAEDRNPRWVPGGGRISFESNRDGAFDIYTMDPDGQNVERVTTNGNIYGGFARHNWSPDGTKMVADAGFEIFVLDADGGNPQPLTNAPNNDTSADWSPDGTKIVFTSSRDNNQEIYVMNADGSGQTNLTSAPDSSESSPVYAPNGQSIIFRSDRTSHGDEVYSMTPSGGSQTRLTDIQFLDVVDPRWQPLAAPRSATPAPTPGGPTPPPESNVDCDFDIDGLDALYMLLWLAELADTLSCLPPGTAVGDPIRYVGDTDCDGDFDIDDVLALLSFFGGATSFEGCE